MKTLIYTYIRENLGIDDDAELNELYLDYLAAVADFCEMMDAAVQDHCAEDLRMSAHSLKGCSANIGAEPVRAVCLEIENAAKQHDFELAAQHIAALFELRKSL